MLWGRWATMWSAWSSRRRRLRWKPRWSRPARRTGRAGSAPPASGRTLRSSCSRSSAAWDQGGLNIAKLFYSRSCSRALIGLKYKEAGMGDHA